MSEVAAVLHREAWPSGKMIAVSAAEPLKQTPILLVEGYEGDVPLIGRARRTGVRHSDPNSIKNCEQPLELQLNDEQDVLRPTACSILDLRSRSHEKHQVLQTIRRNPGLSSDSLVVMLVSSIEEFRRWGPVDPSDCWQMRSPVNSLELTKALRHFLDLYAALAKVPPGQKRGFRRAHRIS